MPDEFVKSAEQLRAEEYLLHFYEQTKDLDYTLPHLPQYYEQMFSMLGEILPGSGLSPKNSKFLHESDMIAVGSDVGIQLFPSYFPPIFHENYFFMLYYVISGEFTIFLEDQELHLAEGNVCIISPHVTHAKKMITDEEVIGIAIRKSSFEKTFPNILKDSHSLLAFYFSRALYKKEPYKYVLFNCEKDTELIGYLREAYEENTAGLPYRSHLQNNLIDRFFVILMRNHEKDIVFKDDLSPRDSEVLTEMAKYIQEHNTNLTLKELAESFNYSERQVQRILKKGTGSSFMEIITNAKMNRASLLLTETDQPVTMIAADLGYKNLGHFRKQFHKIFGKTPSEFRRKQQTEN